MRNTIYFMVVNVALSMLMILVIASCTPIVNTTRVTDRLEPDFSFDLGPKPALNGSNCNERWTEYQLYTPKNSDYSIKFHDFHEVQDICGHNSCFIDGVIHMVNANDFTGEDAFNYGYCEVFGYGLRAKELKPIRTPGGM